MSGLTLYDYELDEGCYKVRLLLRALDLPWTTIPVDMVPGGEQTRPPLIVLNPRGTLPILIDAEGAAQTVFCEAEPILCYLASRYDPQRQWLPQDPTRLAQVMEWLVFAARDLHATVLARRHAMFGEAADAPALEISARRSFRFMEDHMTRRTIDEAAWFVGEAPTLADIALFPGIALSRDHGIDHEAYPALRRWIRRVRTLTGFTTMPGIPDYH